MTYFCDLKRCDIWLFNVTGWHSDADKHMWLDQKLQGTESSTISFLVWRQILDTNWLKTQTFASITHFKYRHMVEQTHRDSGNFVKVARLLVYMCPPTSMCTGALDLVSCAGVGMPWLLKGDTGDRVIMGLDILERWSCKNRAQRRKHYKTGISESIPFLFCRSICAIKIENNAPL